MGNFVFYSIPVAIFFVSSPWLVLKSSFLQEGTLNVVFYTYFGKNKDSRVFIFL